MTIDDQPSAETPDGVDRRAALKKAAIAAGVVAWTTPVVQAVTARPVHAATVTACSPVFTGSATLTGSGCLCTPNAPPQCCDNNTFIIVAAVSNCGPTCLGPVSFDIISIGTAGGEKPGCPPQFGFFRRLACLGSPPTGLVQITADVTCPDGTFFNNLQQTVAVPCTICPGGLDAAAEEDFLPESLDVTEETIPVGESSPPETTLPPDEPPPPPPADPPPADESPTTTDSAGTAPSP